jgi:hypothetical protein
MSIFGKFSERSKKASGPIGQDGHRDKHRDAAPADAGRHHGDEFNHDTPTLANGRQPARDAGGPLSKIDAAARAGHIAMAEIKAPPPVTPSVRADGTQPDPKDGDGEHKQMRLGERLVEMGLISSDQLDVALHERRQGDRFLGEVFVDLGFITQSALSAVLAESAGVDQFDPATAMCDTDLIKQVPKNVATPGPCGRCRRRSGGRSGRRR